MKFTLSWLQDHLATDAPLSAVLDAMTMAGLEVEHWEDPADKLKDFSVAKIISAERHPNADRLQVCQVETVEGMKEIVCGAPNARPGLTTVYAPLGTYIPGSGITLEPRAVRGVVSNGMLCSAAELETAEESDGILELDDALAVGTPAAAALGLADAVIDFEVTPNRPDWLGVVGIARELAAAGVGQLKDHSVKPIAGTFACPVTVTIQSPEACPAFAGRLIKGVKNGPSPKWLADRLRAIGLRPINTLVDITNFISYDRARPLHVYDAAKLSGGIVARMGQAGESFVALDGKSYQLTPAMCVIGDASGPLGLGGIMGGVSSGCSDETVDVFVESALFAPLTIAQTARALGIQSDAKYRFERGVDSGFMVDGLELATAMILELCGGTASEVVVAGDVPAVPEAVPFATKEVHRLTGLELSDGEIDTILSALGFTPEVTGAGTRKVGVPSWRRDVAGSADLVEDIARIAGFDRLPTAKLPERKGRKEPLLTPAQNRVRVGRRNLAARGWMEAVTWSFASRATCELFGAAQGGGALVLANPIASDLDCMRPSALIHLLLAAQRNADRGFGDLALFEAGPIYKGDGPKDQEMVIAGVTRGAIRHWSGTEKPDVFTVKADVLAMLDAMGASTGGMQTVQGARAWWHPGRSGTFKLGPKTILAEFGELHPRVLKELGVDGPVYGFELFLDALPPAKVKAGKTKAKLEASAFMPLTRDFAFVAKADLPAGDLIRAVGQVDKMLISEVSLFDRYQGQGVADGEVSLAVEVALQPRERTLTDAEIEAVSAKIIAAAAKLGARLR
ncbi:PheT Phenylalanyl-tRNA synthetase beta subunit [Caulobacteraceae bacterium]